MTAHREAARHPWTEPGVQADSSVVLRPNRGLRSGTSDRSAGRSAPTVVAVVDRDVDDALARSFLAELPGGSARQVAGGRRACRATPRVRRCTGPVTTPRPGAGRPGPDPGLPELARRQTGHRPLCPARGRAGDRGAGGRPGGHERADGGAVHASSGSAHGHSPRRRGGIPGSPGPSPRS